MALTLIRTAFSGQCDVNGNASIGIPAPGSLHFVGEAVAQVQGNASWTVLVGGLVVKVGTGANVVLGPLLAQANEAIVIEIAGAVGNASVTGTLAGLGSSLLEEVIRVYAPAAHPVGINAASLTTFTKKLTVPHSTSTVFNLPIVFGIKGIALVPNLNGATQMVCSAILGHQSGAVYFNVPIGGISGVVLDGYTVFPFATDISQLDTSVDVTIISRSAVDLPVWVLALTDIETQATGPSSATSPLPRLFDWTESNQFSNGAASLTSPVAPSGAKPILAAYACRVASNAATAFGSAVTFTDSVIGQIWEDGVSIAATADQADHANLSGLAIGGGANGQITMALGVNPGATIFVDMSMGGYFA